MRAGGHRPRQVELEALARLGPEDQPTARPHLVRSGPPRELALGDLGHRGGCGRRCRNAAAPSDGRPSVHIVGRSRPGLHAAKAGQSESKTYEEGAAHASYNRTWVRLKVQLCCDNFLASRR